MSGRGARAAQALVFLFVLALGLLSVHSSETWVALKTGGWIRAHGALPGPDSLSYMSSGAPWRAHDWLGDLLLRGVDALGGPWALIAFKALVIAAAFALVFPLAGADPLLAAGALAFAACGAWPGLTETPRAFDFPMLALLLRLLRASPEFRLSTVWRVGALSAAWANLHPAGAWLGAGVVAVQAFRRGLGAPQGQSFGWAAVLAAAALGLATNPHGGGAWAAELAARPDWRVGPDLFNVYGVYLVGGAAAAWICLQEDFFLAISAVLAGAWSLLAPAQAPLYLLSAAPVIAAALGHFLDARPPTPRGIAGIAAVLGALLLSYAVNVTAPRAGLRGYSSRQGWDGALEFLDARGVSGRMFNDAGSGAYLLWRAAERRPVFVDPRPDVYERDVSEASREWTERWPALAATYRFDYAVVENRAAGYPCRSIDDDPRWALAYWDDSALVYLRKGGPNDRALKAGAYRRLRPNRAWEPVDAAALEDAAGRREAAAEAERAAAEAPRSALAALVAAYVYQRSGDAAGAEELRVAAFRLGLWKPEHRLLDARLLELAGRGPEALGAFRRAALAARRAGEPLLEAKAHAGAGRVLAASGHAGRARRAFLRALELDPSDREARAGASP